MAEAHRGAGPSPSSHSERAAEVVSGVIGELEGARGGLAQVPDAVADVASFVVVDAAVASHAPGQRPVVFA
jgi:hypothetical protein